MGFEIGKVDNLICLHGGLNKRNVFKMCAIYRNIYPFTLIKVNDFDVKLFGKLINFLFL